MDNLAELLEQHQLWLTDNTTGAQLDVRTNDLAGFDFSTYDLSHANISHCDLSNCKFGKCHNTNFVITRGNNLDFSQADITDSTFEKASQSVLDCLPGADWRGGKITRVSSVFTTTPFWSFATDRFIQVGCTQLPWDQINEMSAQDDLTPVEHLPVDPTTIRGWWAENKQAINNWYNEGI